VGTASIHKKVGDPVSTDVQTGLRQELLFEQIAETKRSWLAERSSWQQGVQEGNMSHEEKSGPILEVLCSLHFQSKLEEAERPSQKAGTPPMLKSVVGRLVSGFSPNEPENPSQPED